MLSIDFNTDELDDDFPVYYNEVTGYESDVLPTPEQCGVGLSDEEYAKRLNKVRLMEMEDNNRMRRWELQTYGKTDREYAYGKDWKYIPPAQAIIVNRDNIAQYWQPSNINAGSKTPYVIDTINDIKDPNAQGTVIFDSRSNPDKTMAIADGSQFRKMTAREKQVINTVERLSKGNCGVTLQHYIDMEEASYNQMILNGDFSINTAFNKYINQGGNKTMSGIAPDVSTYKYDPKQFKQIEEGFNTMFNGKSFEEVAKLWENMSNNHVPLNAAQDVLFGGAKLVQGENGTFQNVSATPTPVNTTPTGTFSLYTNTGDISPMGAGLQSMLASTAAQNSNTYIPTAADMAAAKQKMEELMGTSKPVQPAVNPQVTATVNNTQAQSTVTVATGQPVQPTQQVMNDDPVAQMMQRGINSYNQAQSQLQAQAGGQSNPTEILQALMANMANMAAPAGPVAPPQEIHHTVFTAGGVDTRGTLREQLLTVSDMLLSGLNSNNQDIATALSIIMDLAGLDQKELYAKQNVGIDYNIFSVVMDQISERIKYVTDGTGYLINQQLIHYIQTTIINGPNSFIEPLYFYEMLATLAFEGYISLADMQFPELRNSLLQAILYFQKNPMPIVPRDQNHPDGRMNMVPIIFGPNGLLETQMIYLNNNSTTGYQPVAPVATQAVYTAPNTTINNQEITLGGNRMNSIFDRYTQKQAVMNTTVAATPYASLYAGMQGLPASMNPAAAGANNYNYINTGSTVTNTGTYGPAMSPNNIYLNSGTGNAFLAGVQNMFGYNPNAGYGAGYDSVMGPAMANRVNPVVATQPIVANYNTYTQPVTQPVISSRYAPQPVASTTLYGAPPVAQPQQPQIDMMSMMAMMLGMISSVENINGRNVIDVRNLLGMFGGGAGGAGMVERFGKSQPQNTGFFGNYGSYNSFGNSFGNTFGGGTWGGSYGASSWNNTRPAGWGGTTVPSFTGNNWGGTTQTYNSGLGLTFATPTTTGLNLNTSNTPVFNYNPAASVGTGVSNMTFSGNTGTWGGNTTFTNNAGGFNWGVNSGNWGGNNGFVNGNNNGGHSIFGRQGGDKIAAALGLNK